MAAATAPAGGAVRSPVLTRSRYSVYRGEDEEEEEEEVGGSPPQQAGGGYEQGYMQEHLKFTAGQVVQGGSSGRQFRCPKF